MNSIACFHIMAIVEVKLLSLRHKKDVIGRLNLLNWWSWREVPPSSEVNN